MLTALCNRSADQVANEDIIKKGWFDYECRLLKRYLSKITKKYSGDPDDYYYKTAFYETKKYYRMVIGLIKKKSYYAQLNREALL